MIVNAIENLVANNTHEPEWLQTVRAEQRALFMRHGVPTTQKEHWKYTDLSFLANERFELHSPAKAIATEALSEFRLPSINAIRLVFIDGHFAAEHSNISDLPTNIICSDLPSAWQQEQLKKHWCHGLDAATYTFANLNSALCSDGIFLLIPDNCKLDAPIHVMNVISNESTTLYNLRHVMVLGNNADVTLIHENISLTNGNYFNNTFITADLGKHAKLHYVKLQQEAPLARHIQTLSLRQAQESAATLVAVGNTAQFSRDDVIVALQEAGATCQTSGFYRTTRANQYVDHHVAITHSAPLTQSEMVYKGIVEQKSRAVFNGRLLVEKDAQKINAVQANHHLLLAASAEAYSKPELEIYADDVKCRHGATTGQIDQDALFFLRARGINEATAKDMLLAGFADEVLQRISHPSLQHYVQRRLK